MNLTMVLRHGRQDGTPLEHYYTLLDEKYHYVIKKGSELVEELKINSNYASNLDLNTNGELVAIHGALKDYLFVGSKGGFVYPEYGKMLNIVLIDKVEELGKLPSYTCFMDNATLKTLKEAEVQQYLKMNRVANMINGHESDGMPALQGDFTLRTVQPPKEITNPFSIKVQCFTRAMKGEQQVQYAWLIFNFEAAYDLSIMRKKLKELNKDLQDELKKLGASDAIFDVMKTRAYGNRGIATVISFTAMEQWKKLASHWEHGDAVVSVIDYEEGFTDSKARLSAQGHDILHVGSSTTMARLEEFIPYLRFI